MKKLLSRMLLLGSMMIFCMMVLTGCADMEDMFEDSSATTEDYVLNIITPSEIDETTEEFETTSSYDITTAPTEYTLDEDGYYYSKEDVCEYLIEYNTLPSNFITKKEANKLGWSGGALEDYAPGCSIGGDVFGNYEGILPKVKGRTYHECDIDTKGKKRGAKRIVYSDDGNIYYTEDHYESFTLLYGDD